MSNSSIVRSGSGWKSGYRMAILLLAFLAVEIGCNRPRSISQRERDVSLDFQGKFETVAFVRGPVLARWMAHSEGTPESDLVAPYGPFLLALDRLGLNLARQVVGGSTALFVGAYDFQGPNGPPPSLGPVESKACALFLMSGDVSADLQKSLGSERGTVPAHEGVGLNQGPRRAGLMQFHERDEPGSCGFGQVGNAGCSLVQRVSPVEDRAERVLDGSPSALFECRSNGGGLGLPGD
jgi:hypothetical protein